MKALSIRAPWWWFILHGGKDIENRKWWTDYRGPVLVHAGQTVIQREVKEDLFFCQETVLKTGQRGADLLWRNFLDTRSRGAIVGQVDIVDCVSKSNSPWFFGPYGFVLKSPIAFSRPIPFKGSLGLFDVPDELVREAA